MALGHDYRIVELRRGRDNFKSVFHQGPPRPFNGALPGDGVAGRHSPAAPVAKHAPPIVFPLIRRRPGLQCRRYHVCSQEAEPTTRKIRFPRDFPRYDTYRGCTALRGCLYGNRGLEWLSEVSEKKGGRNLSAPLSFVCLAGLTQALFDLLELFFGNFTPGIAFFSDIQRIPGTV